MARREDYVDRRHVRAIIHGEFKTFDPAYDEMRRPLQERFAELGGTLDDLIRSGHDLPCSEQIRDECKWLLNYRSDWARLDSRLGDLQASLADGSQDTLRQGPDGSWAPCTEEFYRKLEPTVDELQARELDPATVKPLRFLRRLADPKRLQDRLWRLQISDIARTGRNDRDELGAMLSGLAQLLFKDDLRALLDDRRLGFRVTPALENAFTDFMAQTQHPRTGYWGPWYRSGGRLFMVQDLSFTFHQISYRQGAIANWERVIETTLAIRDLTYPNGWTPTSGQLFDNHHNYDVVRIFASGWPFMSRALKDRARGAIAEMLRWCLTVSVKDGAFLFDEPFEALYFGVRFLDRVGYWDRAKRFWWRADPVLPEGLPSPVALARQLAATLDSLGNSSERKATVAAILDAAVALAPRDDPSG